MDICFGGWYLWGGQLFLPIACTLHNMITLHLRMAGFRCYSDLLQPRSGLWCTLLMPPSGQLYNLGWLRNAANHPVHALHSSCGRDLRHAVLCMVHFLTIWCFLCHGDLYLVGPVGPVSTLGWVRKKTYLQVGAIVRCTHCQQAVQVVADNFVFTQ